MVQVVLAVGEPIEPANVGVSITIFPLLNFHYDAHELLSLVPTEVSVPNQGANPKPLDIIVLH
jgi:hypothetical protein